MAQAEIEKQPRDLVDQGRGTGFSVSRILGNPAIAGLLMFCAVAYLMMLVFQLRGREKQMDFTAFYVWGEALRQGIDPYSTSLVPFADKLGMTLGCCHENAHYALDSPTIAGPAYRSHCCYDRAGYPPLFVACWVPVSYLSARAAFWLWQGLQFFSLAVVLYLLVGADQSLSIATRVSLMSLGAFFYPVYQNMYFAQPQLSILLGIVIVQHLLARQAEARAGLLLAFLAHMKLYPIGLAAYLVIRGRWRAIAWLAVGIVVGVVLAGLTAGWSSITEFPALMRSLSNDVRQQSISANVHELLGWLIPGLSQRWMGLMVMLTEAIAIAIAVWCTLKSNASLHSDAAAFSIWVVLAVLVGPGWTHYGVMLLMPFALIAACAVRGESVHPAIVWLAAGTYLLASLPYLVFYFFRHYAVFTGYSHFLLLGFIVTLWFAWDAGRRPIPAHRDASY
jgi:Glycosyltransferase family 87